jgi:fatty acid desaturase
LWQHQHTFAHHSHTNDFDHDPDLYSFERWMRAHQHIKKRTKDILQASTFYILFFYEFTSLATVIGPTRMLLTGKYNHGIDLWSDRKRFLRTSLFLFHLTAYVTLVIFLPFWIYEKRYMGAVALYLNLITTGLSFGLFSQINHINEASLEIEQREKARKGRKEILNQSWAVQQVETSNSFCVHSLWWYLISVGLNQQIEHHLFPGLNPCHLSLIGPAVEATCKEYGVTYKCYGSFSELLNSNLTWLNRLANEPDYHMDGKKMD